VKLLVIGAGTGGHIIPGIQVGREFASRGWNVEYACGDRAIETRIYANEGIAPNVVSWPGAASGIGARLRRYAKIAASPVRAWAVLSRVGPDAVISMGGGFSAPILALALLRGIPVWLHESNSHPGRVTRMFAYVAKHVFTGLPVPQQWKNAVQVGTPTRQLPAWAADAGPRILGMGGSQGARRRNECASGAAGELARFGLTAAFTVVGPAIANVPESVTFADYLPNPLEAMSRATLVVSRAGASSLAEIAGIGVPSILVPYPFAKDDHQAKNARVLGVCGGAVVMPEEELTGETLAAQIAALLSDRAKLDAMSRGALTLAAPRAAKDIADVVEADLSGARRVATRANRITRENPT